MFIIICYIFCLLSSNIKNSIILKSLKNEKIDKKRYLLYYYFYFC